MFFCEVDETRAFCLVDLQRLFSMYSVNSKTHLTQLMLASKVLPRAKKYIFLYKIAREDSDWNFLQAYIRYETRYDTNKLKEKNVLETFKITLQNRYQALEEESPDGEEEDEIEKEFHIMEEAYMKTADEVLGRPRKKRKPWITEESWALVDQREEINKKILSTRSERIKK